MKSTANESPGSARATRPARSGRSPADTLGLSWIHGQFHAAAYRRQTSVGTWVAPEMVDSIEQFEAAVDAAIAALDFGGAEAFLILAHEQFVHQMENAPAFSEAAARAYLRSRVERHAQDHGESLWVSQRAESNRRDASYVLHLLPSEFYLRLNEIALRRRLDLTRILPLLVPLQVELGNLGEAPGLPVLLAAEAGAATTLVVGRTPREVLFARTTLASWRGEAARVAVEINRSLLYAKQQFAAAVDRIWIVGPSAESARSEIESKCGAGKTVVVRSGGPAHWLDLVARLPARHPINLVAGYLRQKRRNRLLRRVVIAACFLALVLLGLDAWTREQAWTAESARLRALAAGEETLRAEHARLTQRNIEVQEAQVAVQTITGTRLAALPPKFLGLLATVLPAEARLSEIVVKWDDAEGRWTFRADGTIEADEETTRTLVATMGRQLVRTPLRVRVLESARSSHGTTVLADGTILQGFVLEGGIFED
ncbi:MAG: hypothetical protein IAE82_16300 [Opitutaceae bacterium]|nr:hypothetical protein [Opitutaceae bacterium]